MAPSLSFRRANSNNNNGTPDRPPSAPISSTTPETSGSASTSGLSFPARLLRRKPSTSVKATSSNNLFRDANEGDVPSLIPNTASTTSSFGDPFEQNGNGPTLLPPRRGSEPVVGLGHGTPKKAWGGDGTVVIDAGTGLTNPVMSKSAAEHPFYSGWTSAPRTSGETARTRVDGLDGPSSLTPAPSFPTPLSPPRRPMPTSRSFAEASPIAHAVQNGAESGTPSRLGVTTEWLSRRPSGRRAQDYSPRKDSPSRPKGILGGPAPIRQHSSSRSRNISSSSTDASTSGADSEDGEIGLTPSKRRSRSDGQGNGAYEVEVVCKDHRGEDEMDEMKWEVVIRRRKPAEGAESSSNTASTSPLQISTAGSVAQAPHTASSINLSLSLDQPTGKLVFIAFPMDIHATPRRRPTTGSNSTPSSSTRFSSSRPSTPPAQSQAPLRPSTPPPAPNPNSASPPSTPPRSLGHRKRISQSSLWPSPMASGRRSPPLGAASPRGGETWTPRRTRMVSASELNGGLYAQGTLDGMSEVLESTSISSGTNGTGFAGSTLNGLSTGTHPGWTEDAREADDRRTRWQNDRI